VAKREELRLEVFAVGEPAPLYNWYKDDREIVPDLADDNISISNEGFGSVLTIHRMSAAEAGRYRCSVSNNFGSVDSAARVQVCDVRAHFVSAFPDRVEVVEGKPLVLELELSEADASVIFFENIFVILLIKLCHL
jgi:hypothetical protein